LRQLLVVAPRDHFVPGPFQGGVRIVFGQQETREASRAPGTGASITFEPGARGQTLIVISGVARVQKSGGPIEEVRPGDVVWFELGEKHWHGASPTVAMTHVAIQEALNGKPVDWMEKVPDEQYNAK
jgi:quercetin dioxygenase-like cupin family protein